MLEYETSKFGPTVNTTFTNAAAGTLQLVDVSAFVESELTFRRRSFMIQVDQEVYLRQGDGSSGHTVTSDQGTVPASMRWRIDVDHPKERYLKALGVSASGTLKATCISDSGFFFE